MKMTALAGWLLGCRAGRQLERGPELSQLLLPVKGKNEREGEMGVMQSNIDKGNQI